MDLSLPVSTSIDNDLATFHGKVLSLFPCFAEDNPLYDSQIMESQIEKRISWASSPGVRNSMQGNKSRDTKPELVVRRYLHAAGLRYRVHTRPIKDWNRRADIVFPRTKIAVFVNGCYWHGCPKHYKQPQTNTVYWSQKIRRNVERDAETFKRLRAEKWLVITIWEHEDLEKKAEEILVKVKKRLKSIQT